MEFVSPPLTVRRNPPRKAKTPASKPPEALLPSSTSSSAAARPPLRPIHSNLQSPPSDEEKKPLRQKPSESASDAETLRIFLRIRPAKELKIKRNAALTKPRAKEEGERVCLVANDSRSVTLKAPSLVADSKRIKKEIFDGFSHVFSPQSSQAAVYERVMQPLVMDFLAGSSRLLIAMGPTGSGKTHTVFGDPDKPGLVPLALRELFTHSRIYYISMLEIYSEQGRGERMFDLLQDGRELSLQHSSSIKGLHECKVEDITQAETLLTHGMLSRTTAVTNANSQSSRSQCITNIRLGSDLVSEDDASKVAVLTVADLAGAERERKTGNQGKRLLQSGFINNTSLVLGQCLRALLEHQQNPKKQLQKHFHGSLLTRYLREYMEAKKRMTLILTAGPSEDDYGDTSFLLRQASPYMRIRFDNVEEPANLYKRKRQIGTLNKSELSKRRKCNDFGSNMMEQGGGDKRDDCTDGCKQLIEPTLTSSFIIPYRSKTHGNPDNSSFYNNDLQRTRMEHVRQKFCRALWTVLKEYKEKLVVSENELVNLRRSFERERGRVLELEKELLHFKVSCTCIKSSMSIPMPLATSDDFCHSGHHDSLDALPDNVNATCDFSAGEKVDDSVVKVTCMSSPCLNTEESSSYDVKPGGFNGQADEASLGTESIEASVAVEGAVDERVDCSNDQPNGVVNTELQSSQSHGKLLQKQQMAKDVDSNNHTIGAALVVAPTSEASSHIGAVPIVCGPCLPLGTDSTSNSNSHMSSSECTGPIGRLLEGLTGITLNEIQKGLWENDKLCMLKVSTLSSKYGERLDKMDIDSWCSMDESHCLRYCFALIHEQAVQNNGIMPTREATSKQDQLHAITMAASVARAIDHVKMLERKKIECSTVQPDVDKPRRRLLPASSMLKHATCFNMEDDITEDGVRAAGRKKTRGNEKVGTQGRMELVRLLKGSQPL